MWKSIRIVLLLSVLLYVVVDTWRDQNKNWDQTTIVLLHPINADGDSVTQNYIERLNLVHFQDANDFLKNSATEYRSKPTSIYFQLGRQLYAIPPVVPEGNILDAMLWSLKFRYYAWQQHQSADGHPSVTLYLNFYNPKKTHVLKHSTALEKGRIGSVNLFASKMQQDQNSIVLAHELLHAFGATDKYDLSTGQPIFPVGYANPEQKPLYPQYKAELMAGHIALSQTTNKMPDQLSQVVVNTTTAKEIGWIK